MKKLILFIFIFLSSFSIVFAQWSQTNGPNSNVTYVKTLAVSGSYIYVGTATNSTSIGIYMSTNNGSNWIEINNGLTDLRVNQIITNGSIVYAVTTTKIFVSTDNGTNWTSISNSIPASYHFYSLYIFGTNLIIGADQGGVFFSSNNGISWDYRGILSAGPVVVNCFLVSGTNLFAGTTNGIFLSTNNGLTWVNRSNGLLDQTTYSLVQLGGNLYCGNYGWLSKSTNSGVTWTATSLPTSIVNCIIVSGSNLIAATQTATIANTGIFLSTDYGISWMQKNQGIGYPAPYALSLAVVNNFIFAGVSSHAVWRRSLNDILTNIQSVSQKIPSKYYLSQNYPNPFNPITNIKFAIPKNEFVTIKVYNVAGKEIKELVNQIISAGEYKIDFDGTGLESGVYFYRIKAGEFLETKKMILIK